MAPPNLDSDELPIVLSNISMYNYRYQFDKKTDMFGSRPHLIKCVEFHMHRLIKRLPARWQVGLYYEGNRGWEKGYRNEDAQANLHVTDEMAVNLVASAQDELWLALLSFDEVESRFRDMQQQEAEIYRQKCAQRKRVNEEFVASGYEIRYDGGTPVLTAPHLGSGRQNVSFFRNGRWMNI